jgi:hypothetical protein
MFPITWPTSLPRKDPPAKPRLVVMLLSSVGLSVMQMLQHVDFDLHKGKFQVTSPYHLWRITNLSAIVCEFCANGVSILSDIIVKKFSKWVITSLHRRTIQPQNCNALGIPEIMGSESFLIIRGYSRRVSMP